MEALLIVGIPVVVIALVAVVVLSYRAYKHRKWIRHKYSGKR